MYTLQQANDFFDAVESLKKYRRADLTDDNGLNLLKELYTDLLPNDFILKKCLKEHTTYLVGRKGTGKSTIFLRLEQELREKKGYLPCYIDIYTVYQAADTKLPRIDGLENFLQPSEIQKYLIQRSFIQAVLIVIIDEITNKFNNLKTFLLGLIGIQGVDDVKESLEELKNNIENNRILQEIELPALAQYQNIERGKVSSNKRNTANVDVALDKQGFSLGSENNNTSDSEWEHDYSSIFLKVFKIQEIILKIKEILATLKIKHLYILLDDFSEIDDKALKTFVDVVLAPLNNWSDEFIKFKIAAYPNRLYYGKVDPGKVDTINLDFYNLYSEFNRDKMESHAVDFTKRLIEKRVNRYVGASPEIFFETNSNITIDDYYEILFNVSMNVPRILGYILSYCYQSKIIYSNKITKQDIEAASEKYYSQKISVFFDTTTHSLMSIDEKVSVLQLKNLLNKFVERSKEIKKKITTKELKGEIYIISHPYSSHFHFDPRYEEFLKTLELNFFISKYNDISDKDGTPVSIYALNFGLCNKENILWGKPKGTKYRKYFIERPFNYNKLISEFLENTKRIYCSNSDCGRQFSEEHLSFLEFNHFKCNDCTSNVLIESMDEHIKETIKKIDSTVMLPLAELKILQELKYSELPKYAKDISQEIDYSKQLISHRAKKLAEQYNLVHRIKDGAQPYKYKLTDKGDKFFIGWGKF